jgi:hypothetical protein
VPKTAKQRCSRDVYNADKQGISPKQLNKLQGFIARLYNRGIIDEEQMKRWQSRSAKAKVNGEPAKKLQGLIARPGADKTERRHYDRDPD